MNIIMFVLVMGGLGAGMGSFTCCQVCRLRRQEEGKKKLGSRSVCLFCHKQLKWYENIPILSWVLQRGKCRKCGKEIGKAEILSEVAGAVSFMMLGAWFAGKYFPQFFELGLGGTPRAWTWAWFLVLLIFMTVLLVLAIYDARYGKLPVGVLYGGVAVAGVFMIARAVSLGFTAVDVTATGERIFEFTGIDWKGFLLARGAAAGLLGGIYYILYKVSNEKLVGGGDWLVCLMIGMVLGDWWLALWELFVANFLGAAVMLGRRKKRTAFGPFLVVAFVIGVTFSTQLQMMKLGMV